MDYKKITHKTETQRVESLINAVFFRSVLKLGLTSLMILTVATFGISQVYAETETFEFNIDEEHNQIEITGKILPPTDVFVTIWNYDQEKVIQMNHKIADNQGSFQYIFNESDLSGFGSYTGEISDGKFTQGFEFSLNDPIVSPLKQMNNGIAPQDVLCKSMLVKMYKPSSEDDNNPACVKSHSLDKLELRGWVIA